MCAAEIWRGGRRDWIIIGWDPVVGCSRHDNEPSYLIQVVDFDDPNNCESVAVLMSSESSWLYSCRFWWRAAEASTVRKFITWNTILVVLMEQNITLYGETTSVFLSVILCQQLNSGFRKIRDIRLSPRCTWDLRFSGILRSIDW